MRPAAVVENKEEELVRANAIEGETFAVFVTRIRQFNYNTPN